MPVQNEDICSCLDQRHLWPLYSCLHIWISVLVLSQKLSSVHHHRSMSKLLNLVVYIVEEKDWCDEDAPTQGGICNLVIDRDIVDGAKYMQRLCLMIQERSHQNWKQIVIMK